MDTNIPYKIWPKQEIVKMLGINNLPLELNTVIQTYFFKEPSGIIRTGCTVELFQKYREYFYIWDETTQTWEI